VSGSGQSSSERRARAPFPTLETDPLGGGSAPLA
jgi:hypothetical protein